MAATYKTTTTVEIELDEPVRVETISEARGGPWLIEAVTFTYNPGEAQYPYAVTVHGRRVDGFGEPATRYRVASSMDLQRPKYWWPAYHEPPAAIAAAVAEALAGGPRIG